MYIPDEVMIDIPLPIMSDRLLLRSFISGDGEIIHAAVDESLDYLQEWIPWAYRFGGNCPAPSYFERIARKLHASFIMRTELHFLIFLRHNNHLVGSCSLHNINWKTLSAELGFWGRTSEIDDSFIKEAVSMLIEVAFTHINLCRLNIICDNEDIKSLIVPQALGFQLEVEALGLIAKPGVKQLRLGRLYVKFNPRERL